ncbi:MAG: hypothetical protein GC161_17895 [Planctomycetaceae bacterium]|nr:hypothetical protein [Planctomycetaceae bacterium]
MKKVLAVLGVSAALLLAPKPVAGLGQIDQPGGPFQSFQQCDSERTIVDQTGEGVKTHNVTSALTPSQTAALAQLETRHLAAWRCGPCGGSGCVKTGDIQIKGGSFQWEGGSPPTGHSWTFHTEDLVLKLLCSPCNN